MSGHHDASALLERRFNLPDEAATCALGARFAHALDLSAQAGLQVHLLGDLGAGKTTLVRAILRALGHASRVRSPTYTLVEPYHVVTAHGALHLYHFDLYRFNDPAEWADAGFRDYFDGNAVCLVEWPQRAQALLGAPDLEFTLEVCNDNGNGNGDGDGDGSDNGNEYRENHGRILTARAYSHSGKTCLEKC